MHSSRGPPSHPATGLQSLGNHTHIGRRKALLQWSRYQLLVRTKKGSHTLMLQTAISLAWPPATPQRKAREFSPHFLMRSRTMHPTRAPLLFGFDSGCVHKEDHKPISQHLPISIVRHAHQHMLICMHIVAPTVSQECALYPRCRHPKPCT